MRSRGGRARGAKARSRGAWSAYRGAGVDIDAGERAVELMRASVEATRRPEVIGGLGGFASAMALPAGMREPILVSSTDGVGTKTAIAMALGRYDTVGHDLVAMCADDLVCAGAEPLFFLDYVAVGRVFPERVAAIVALRRRRLPPRRLLADRRRDGRAPRADGARRVRPGRLLRRRRRARPAARRDGGAGRRRA